MATFSEHNIFLADFDQKVRVTGRLKVRHFSIRERMTRAAMYFAVLVVLAVASVIIPILHFILVPAFSFAAVASAAMMFLQTEEVTEAKGVCPYCGKETALKRAMIAKEFRDSCEHCLQLITGSEE